MGPQVGQCNGARPISGSQGSETAGSIPTKWEQGSWLAGACFSQCPHPRIPLQQIHGNEGLLPGSKGDKRGFISLLGPALHPKSLLLLCCNQGMRRSVGPGLVSILLLGHHRPAQQHQRWSCPRPSAAQCHGHWCGAAPGPGAGLQPFPPHRLRVRPRTRWRCTSCHCRRWTWSRGRSGC